MFRRYYNHYFSVIITILLSISNTSLFHSQGIKPRKTLSRELRYKTGSLERNQTEKHFSPASKCRVYFKACYPVSYRDCLPRIFLFSTPHPNSARPSEQTKNKLKLPNNSFKNFFQLFPRITFPKKYFKL